MVDKAYDVRLTVIGVAYACRFDSQLFPEASVDWRRGDVEWLPHDLAALPDEIASRCIDLTHSYGLRFAVIDFARGRDGTYISSS